MVASGKDVGLDVGEVGCDLIGNVLGVEFVAWG